MILKEFCKLKIGTQWATCTGFLSVNHLPSEKILIAYIKEAARLNEEGIKKPARKKTAIVPKDLEIPDALIKAFSKAKKARQVFDTLSPSHRKEYIQWIQEAKTDSTRDNRIKTTIEWVTEGKSRHWKYHRKN